jgi:hypothetical protein
MAYYDNPDPCPESGLLPIFTHVATIMERRKFIHLQRMYGLICKVFFPIDGYWEPVIEPYDPMNTDEGSMFNREDNQYRYNTEPDIDCINMPITNLMDLTRMDATTNMHQLDFNRPIYAYTTLSMLDSNNGEVKCGIPPNSKIEITYNFKNFVMFAFRNTALDSPYEIDGKAVYRIELTPHL